MYSSKNIVLIGFMGVGKTSVGTLLSNKLKYDFSDSDDIIQYNSGISIEDIFSRYGEKHFRELENITIRKISRRKKTVIATGGGVVLNPENIELLRKNGLIILLKANPETILRNLLSDKSKKFERPLLKGDDINKKIEDLLIKRVDFYNCYDFAVNTDYLSISEVSEEVITILKTRLPGISEYILNTHSQYL